MTTNRFRQAPGFTRVRPTADELDEYRRKDVGHRGPTSYRVRCDECHKRIWGSGLGIGSHRRACPGVPPANGNPDRHRVVAARVAEVGADFVTAAALTDLSWSDAQDEWKRLDDARRAGNLPNVAYLVVRSEADPDVRWAKAHRGNWDLTVRVTA